MDNENIILIGMPAAGKSTVGVVLAKVLKRRFLDTDLLLQELAGRTLAEQIDVLGSDGFVRFENENVSRLEADNTVIATGGSVVYGADAMEHLGTMGIIVYLKQSYNEIENRLGSLVKRGVVMREGFTLRDLYNERVPLYERYADITVELTGLTMEQSVLRLADVLSNVNKK